MARRQRPFALSSTSKVSTALANADVKLTSIICPSDGAYVDRFIVTATTAGVGTGTAAVILQKRGTATAVAGSGTFDLDAAAGVTIVMEGNAVSSVVGTEYDLNLVFTGTTTTAATVTCMVVWLP